MALIPRLDLRQTQSLVMTPQLQQAIKLLQLNNLELTAIVEQEIERNPLLRTDEGQGDENQDDEGDGEQGGGDPATGDETTARDTLDLAVADGLACRDDASLDTDYDNMWNSESAGAAGPGLPGGSQPISLRGGGSSNALEQTVSDEVSLRNHLLAQIDIDIVDPVHRMIASHLVDMLDDAGYIARDLTMVAGRLGCETVLVEETVVLLQRLDPTGIFARDLAECLALQLRERNRLDPAMQALLENLDLVAKREVGALVKTCGVDREDVVDMVAEIRALNPKPALTFDAVVPQPVTPDVILRPLADGEWLVELNNETLPRVLVDNQYYAKIRRGVRQKDELAYLSEQLQSANWFVRSLHQRATTILRVSKEIVRQQQAFFLHGVRHLKPLILRDIATEIEMHESTVSRVTNNKYMSTPWGVYELKYFFSAALAGTGAGETHSAESVRDRIKALIDAESVQNVLSDDTIVASLKALGIDIARRTVAKYRVTMKIPSSVQRRRQKKSAF